MEENQVEQVAEAQSNDQVTQEEVQQETPKTLEIRAEKTAAEVNWEEARAALQLQKQQIAELQAKLAQQNQPVHVEEPDELADLDPSDYVTVEKAQKLAAKQAKQVAKQVVGEYMAQQNLTMDEQRMRAKHEDYDWVIENYAAPLIKQDPALAYKIQTSKNPAETAYRLGKLSDNYEDQMAAKQNTQKVEKILKNSNRPTSGNALGTPLKGQTDQVTKMTPEQIWSQSQKYARGA